MHYDPMIAKLCTHAPNRWVIVDRWMEYKWFDGWMDGWMDHTASSTPTVHMDTNPNSIDLLIDWLID